MNDTAQTAIRPDFDSWLKRHATPLVVVLSVVVGITGVMMFFHFLKGEVEAMHEWLGMAFVAAAILHAVRHRRPLTGLLAESRLRGLALVTFLVVAAFVVLAPPKGGNPFRDTTRVVLQAPLSKVAPLYGLDAGEAVRRLGVTGADQESSLEQIAAQRGGDPVRLLMQLSGRQ